MPSRLSFATAFTLLIFAASPSWAADTGPAPAAVKADKLGAARAQIAQKNWPAALDELKRANDTGNADWNNLMGFTLRKSASPDYASAGKYYDAALQIDPKHRGALEYSGELYLMTNDLPKAEARVATLDKVCSGSCDELSDLKKAVARYKSNGNKYVAAPW
jgi:tetratricopeptide (TPR) repeat protein